MGLTPNPPACPRFPGILEQKLIEYLVNLLSPYIASYGYVILIVLLVLEGAGLPVPGETVLLIVAAFAAHGDLSIVMVVVVAAASAIVGDSIGYSLGRNRREWVHQWLARHGDGTGLARSEAFFHKHGPKALIVARFIPVIRVFTAVVVGLNGMPARTFVSYELVGATFWAATIALLGYLFGSNLALLDEIIHRIGFSLLVALVLIAGSIWLMRRLSNQESHVRARLERISQRLRLPQLLAWLRYRFNPASGAAFVVTVSFGVSVISGWLFSGITHDVLEQQEFALYDASVAVWFLLNSTADSRAFFLAMGFLALPRVILVGTGLTAIGLLWQRQWRWLIALLVSVGGGVTLNLLLTQFVKRTPPAFPATLVPARNYSFPADEPMHAVLFYGFLAYLMVRSRANWGWQVAVALGVMTLLALIGLSQMALGTHYLTDVIAGLVAGTFWLAVTILLSELIAPDTRAVSKTAPV